MTRPGQTADWEEADADEEEPETITFGICWVADRLFEASGTTGSLSRFFDWRGAALLSELAVLLLAAKLEPEETPGLNPYYWFADCGVEDEDDLRRALRGVDSRAVEHFFHDRREALQALKKPEGGAPRWIVFDCPLYVKDGFGPLPGCMREQREDRIRLVTATVICSAASGEVVGARYGDAAETNEEAFACLAQNLELSDFAPEETLIVTPRAGDFAAAAPFRVLCCPPADDADAPAFEAAWTDRWRMAARCLDYFFIKLAAQSWGSGGEASPESRFFVHILALSLRLMAAVRLGRHPQAAQTDGDPVDEAFFFLKNLRARRMKTRTGDVAWRVEPPTKRLLEIIRALGLPKPPQRVERR